MVKPVMLAACALLIAGCAAPTRPLYQWGAYEELIYQSWREPGSTPLEKQVELLQHDYQQGQAHNLRMPPGWHAHLAMLYARMGRQDEAIKELAVEKAEFPESVVFVDRMLANMKGS